MRRAGKMILIVSCAALLVLGIVAAGNWFFTLTMNGQEVYEGGVSCQMEYLENAK